MPFKAYCNILLALDDSRASAGAVRATEALFLTDGVRASVIHAYQPPRDSSWNSAGIDRNHIPQISKAWEAQAKSEFRDLMQQASIDFSRYELGFENSPTTTAISDAVARVNPDLLVLGTRGHGRLRRALLGSVANGVMASAECDVLVVPEGTIGRSSVKLRRQRGPRDVATGPRLEP
jgi:nucleotide-binding universal stress UspA family protein